MWSGIVSIPYQQLIERIPTLPSGETWHRDLLRQMTQDQEEVRPSAHTYAHLRIPPTPFFKRGNGGIFSTGRTEFLF